MFNKAIPFVVFLLLANCNQQNTQYIRQVAAHRMQLNETFFNPETTPLDSVQLKNFKGLKFFPVNDKFKIQALLEPTPHTKIFDLPHTNNLSKPYKIFGWLTFEIENKTYKLMALEPVIKKSGYENKLLVPFNDLTNGKSTYSGGRYLDIAYDGKNIQEMDFNYSYNPYCAYNHKFVCPIPPPENLIPLKIEAGMKYEAIE